MRLHSLAKLLLFNSLSWWIREQGRYVSLSLGFSTSGPVLARGGKLAGKVHFPSRGYGWTRLSPWEWGKDCAGIWAGARTHLSGSQKLEKRCLAAGHLGQSQRLLCFAVSPLMGSASTATGCSGLFPGMQSWERRHLARKEKNGCSRMDGTYYPGKGSIFRQLPMPPALGPRP